MFFKLKYFNKKFKTQLRVQSRYQNYNRRLIRNTIIEVVSGVFYQNYIRLQRPKVYAKRTSHAFFSSGNLLPVES